MQRLGDSQQQQPGDGGGLAGAGPAGDQQQRAAQCERGGLGLAVGGGRRRLRALLVERWRGQARALTRASGTLFRRERGCLREQLREQRGQRGRVEGRLRVGGDAAQALRQAAFVLAVAAQVEQAVFEHQRAVGRGWLVRGGLGYPA